MCIAETMSTYVNSLTNHWAIFDKSGLKKLGHYLKVLWLLFVTAVVGHYLFANGNQLRQTISLCSLPSFLFALTFILLGRTCVCKIAQMALLPTEGKFSFAEMFRLYNRTQLCKYIPGGLWHIVGRAAMYTRFGVEPKAAGRALLRENCWLIVSSCSLGLLLCGQTLLQRAFSFDGKLMGLLLTLCALSFFYGLSSLFVNRLVGGKVKSSLAWQIATWSCFGLAFAFLLPLHLNLSNIGLAIGTFSLAFGLGLAFPIAPSGIGIREAVIIWFFVGTLTPQESIGAAAMSRVLWTLGEFVMAFISELPIGKR